MSALIVNDRAIELDKDGYLLDLQDWSSDVAAALAEREALPLSDEHWEILVLLRAFHAEFQLSPANRPLIKYVASNWARTKATACISIACSMALLPNSPPSWRACPSPRIAYEPDYPSRTPFRPLRAHSRQGQARRAQPDP